MQLLIHLLLQFIQLNVSAGSNSVKYKVFRSFYFKIMRKISLRSESPSFDYVAGVEGNHKKSSSFPHIDPMQTYIGDRMEPENRNGTGCCFGIVFGAGVASIAYLVAYKVHIHIIGDIIVIIFFCLSCILPIHGLLSMYHFQPKGIRNFLGEMIEATPICCGPFAGIGSTLSLIIIHLILRFTVYPEINEDHNLGDIVWVVFIGTILVFMELLLFCYIDSKTQTEPYDDDRNVLLSVERDDYG